MIAECVFCQIAQRNIPANILTETATLMAFHDVHPQAPTHLLIIPKAHLPTVNDLTASTASLISDMVLLAKELAASAGLAQGYRLVMNCGAQAGQSVWHLHLHLLGGRPMAWPPG